MTICTYRRACRFGDVTAGAVQLNHVGIIVTTVWQDIPVHFPTITLDEFVVMPNHVHGILMLSEPTISPLTEAAPSIDEPSRTTSTSLSRIVGAFKSNAAREVHIATHSSSHPLWQRGYYDHVIRSEESLRATREYIVNNPMQWAQDEENPDRITPGRNAASAFL